MDPSKPGSSFAGGLASEVGGKPSVKSDIPPDEYYEKSGVNDARHRPQWCIQDNGFNGLQNTMTTAKTADPVLALRRLQTFQSLLTFC